MKVNESIELSESDAIAQNSDNKMHRIEER